MVGRLNSGLVDEGKFEEYLETGETIIWSGRPDIEVGWRPEEVGEYAQIVPFAALAAAFILWLMTLPGADKGAALMAVIVTVTVLFIGILLGAIKVHQEQAARRCISYAISNRRILELWTLPSDFNAEIAMGMTEGSIMTMVTGSIDKSKLFQIRLDDLCQIETTGNADGSGSMQFGTHARKCPTPVSKYRIMSAADPRRQRSPLFVLVPEVRHVAEVIRKQTLAA